MLPLTSSQELNSLVQLLDIIYVMRRSVVDSPGIKETLLRRNTHIQIIVLS